MYSVLITIYGQHEPLHMCMRPICVQYSHDMREHYVMYVAVSNICVCIQRATRMFERHELTSHKSRDVFECIVYILGQTEQL